LTAQFSHRHILNGLVPNAHRSPNSATGVCAQVFSGLLQEDSESDDRGIRGIPHFKERRVGHPPD
jgi:hypothetical protein